MDYEQKKRITGSWVEIDAVFSWIIFGNEQ